MANRKSSGIQMVTPGQGQKVQGSPRKAETAPVGLGGQVKLASGRSSIDSRPIKREQKKA